MEIFKYSFLFLYIMVQQTQPVNQQQSDGQLPLIEGQETNSIWKRWWFWLIIIFLIIIVAGFVVWAIESRKQIEPEQADQIESEQGDNKLNSSFEYIDEFEVETREVACGDGICDLIEMANKNCPQDCGGE